MKSLIAALISGSLFAAGLILGGMTQPAKIVGFLDFAGNWDPSLMFVMGGAVGVHTLLFRIITRRPAPMFAARFHIPTRRGLDGQLIAGAAIFGVGWGLGGYCPGPALTSLASGLAPIAFVSAMIAGMAVHDVLVRRRLAREIGTKS